LKQLTKRLIAAKISAQKAFLKSILNKECKCWLEFYNYVKMGMEIAKTFLPSKTIMNGSSQTR